MKIRLDFVSNSSSCSFTVENVSKLMDLFIPLGDLPYMYDEFNFQVTCKHKDFAKLYEIIHGEPYTEKTWWGSEQYKMKPEDDETFYINDYNSFINKWNEIPEDLKSRITHFYISCDDYNYAHVGLLNMMYDLCELDGLNPTDEYTEIDFRPGRAKYDNFLTNLGMKLKELKEQSKCQTP